MVIYATEFGVAYLNLPGNQKKLKWRFRLYLVACLES